MVYFTRLDVIDSGFCRAEKKLVDLVEIKIHTLEEIIEGLTILL